MPALVPSGWELTAALGSMRRCCSFWAASHCPVRQSRSSWHTWAPRTLARAHTPPTAPAQSKIKDISHSHFPQSVPNPGSQPLHSWDLGTRFLCYRWPHQRHVLPVQSTRFQREKLPACSKWKPVGQELLSYLRSKEQLKDSFFLASSYHLPEPGHPCQMTPPEFFQPPLIHQSWKKWSGWAPVRF